MLCIMFRTPFSGYPLAKPAAIGHNPAATPAVRLLLDSGLDSGLGSSSLNAELCGNLRLVLLTELCSDKLYSDMSLSCKALALAGKAGAEHPCSSPLSPLHQLGTNIRLSY